MPVPIPVDSSKPRGICCNAFDGRLAAAFLATTAVVAEALDRVSRDEADSAATRRSAARTAASRNVSPAYKAGAWHIEITRKTATVRMVRPFDIDTDDGAPRAAASPQNDNEPVIRSNRAERNCVGASHRGEPVTIGAAVPQAVTTCWIELAFSAL
jgi:hypothetical protein